MPKILRMSTDKIKSIFILGTSHLLQRGLADAPEGTYGEFQRMIRHAAQHHSVRTIGEEMSVMALDETVSLAKNVAAELDVSHKFCDPDKTERLSLGLPVVDDPSTWAGREAEWLNRLQFVEFPVLFICGAEHVHSFEKKCTAHGIVATVLEGDWAPARPIPLEYRIL